MGRNVYAQIWAQVPILTYNVGIKWERRPKSKIDFLNRLSQVLVHAMQKDPSKNLGGVFKTVKCVFRKSRFEIIAILSIFGGFLGIKSTF